MVKLNMAKILEQVFTKIQIINEFLKKEIIPTRNKR